MADPQPASGREPDAVDLLLHQHARIEDLFRDVLTSTGRVRRDTFDELTRLLVLHETIEEEVVHPTARSLMDEGAAVVDTRLAEENDAKRMLLTLTELDPNSDEFDALLVALRDTVLAHARREERYEFGYLRQKLNQDQLRTMARVVSMVENLAPTRSHPAAESAVGDVVTGPPIALAEQLRDAIRQQ